MTLAALDLDTPDSALLPVYDQLEIEPARGRGARLETVDGRELVDFYGGHAVAILGYRHPRLARGAPIRVEGCSYLQWRDKVHLHRDYFDAGALLYEHLPLLGGTIGWLKRRLA